MNSKTASYSFIDDSVENSPALNVRRNIISGPRDKDYWFHSPGLEMPEVREEGSFPIQGNIGSLLKQEYINNYVSCSNNFGVSGGPNCSNVFNKDVYTQSNTCGDKCGVSGPESYGIQSFGIVNEAHTNMHGLHAYQNIRAGTEGKGPADIYGCYESVPSLTSDKNTCITDYGKFEANTVGNFTKLPSWQNFSSYSYKN